MKVMILWGFFGIGSKEKKQNKGLQMWNYRKEFEQYNRRKVIDMRKKQKISIPIIKIEEQSYESEQNQSKSFSKKRSGQDSADQGQRKSENTLSLLTKNFIALIKSKQNMTIDSNDAAKQLGIQKRRIYDITNVLQGIGYVEKVHKNKLRWVGGVKDPKVSCQIDSLDSEISSLQRKQFDLTCKIDYLERRIKNDFIQNKELNYIRLNYFKQIMQNLASKPSRIVVVKAPKDSTLISRKKEGSNEVEVEINFGKSSKGAVYYVTRKPEIQMQEQKIPKKEETEQIIKQEY